MKLRLTATGDSFIVRPPAHTSAEFQAVAGVIARGDVRFTNLETVIRRGEGFPSAQSGGTWASSPPEVLDALAAYQFNCLTSGNNHTLDYSYGGLEATLKYLDAAGWVHAGAGRDLEEASAWRTLTTPRGKVAILGVTASYHESWSAGAPRPHVTGRPGVNGLGHKTVYRVSQEKLNQLTQIARECGVNALDDLRIKEGFKTADPEGIVRFGNHQFALADKRGEGEFTTPSIKDAAHIIDRIYAAAKGHESVVVSLHAHQGKNSEKTLPADFMIDFARACIDAGAHAVIGHGPHVLRGIEIYRDRPIFYSLGNFIFQNELVAHLPTDFYNNYSIPPELNTREALAVRSKNGTLGLGVNPSVWRSVIASWEMDGGRLTSLELIPIDLGQHQPVEQRGIPILTSDCSALEEVVELSGPFGSNFQIEKGRAVYRA